MLRTGLNVLQMGASEVQSHGVWDISGKQFRNHRLILDPHQKNNLHLSTPNPATI